MSDMILGNMEKEIAFLETDIQDCLIRMYKEKEQYKIDMAFDKAILQLVSYHARCRERRFKLNKDCVKYSLSEGKLKMGAVYGMAALEAGKEDKDEMDNNDGCNNSDKGT